MTATVARNSTIAAAAATPSCPCSRPSLYSRVMNTSVEPFGAPLVSRNTSVKLRSPRSAARVNRIVMTGRSAGSVTCTNRRNRLAPSTAADSYRFRSTVDSPARKIIMSYGAPRHTPTRITDGSAWCWSTRNGSGPSPTRLRIEWSTPVGPG